MAAIANEIDRILQAAATRLSNPANAAILLTASTSAFHVAAGGANDPASISFTASLIALEGPIVFSCTGGTLTVAGNVATLTYANMPGQTASVTASVTANGATVTSNTCFVSKILDGVNGTTGLNNARVYAYQRSSTVPTLKPGNITVTFASNSITDPAALLNGWVRDIPSTNGNPLYVVAISGAGTGSTVSLLNASWSEPVAMATDGPGGTGTNGTNGLNAATITVYQRSASATAPAKPSLDCTYTFATGVLSGLNNGWTQAYPALDLAKPHMHVSIVTAISATATDTVPASEFGTVQLLYDASAVITAQAQADAANVALDKIFTNGVLSRDEKPDLIQRYAAILEEKDIIADQAIAIGVSYTGFSLAANALTAYLNGLTPAWNDLTQHTDITRGVADGKWNDYYTAKVALLNSISTKVKSDAALDATTKANAAQAAAISTAATAAQAKADLAETTAKAYADGKVTAEETRAIADATAKANAAEVAAKSAAALDATAKANVAATTATGLTLGTTGVLTGPGGAQGQMTALPTIDMGNGAFFGARDRNDAPSEYPWGTTKQFKVSTSVGLIANTTYCTLETIKQFVDPSGGGIYQYAYQGQFTYRRFCGDPNAAASGWGAWVQDLDRNAYTGDMNASSDINFIASSGVLIEGNTMRRTLADTGAWDQQVYTPHGFVGGAYASVIAYANTNVIFGLNVDPTTNAHWTSIDYAVYLNTAGGLDCFESGDSRGALGAYLAGDTIAVKYDGSRITYEKNGVVLRTVVVNITAPLFFDSSFYGVFAGVRGVRFVPLSSNNFDSVGGPNKPQNGATVGAPAGTLVGGTDAATVAAGAANGTTALNSINNPIVISITNSFATSKPNAPTVLTPIGSATANISGGSGSYSSISWAVDYVDTDPEGQTVSMPITGVATTTVSAKAKVPNNTRLLSAVSVTVVDSAGRVGTKSAAINCQFGTPL